MKKFEKNQGLLQALRAKIASDIVEQLAKTN